MTRFWPNRLIENPKGKIKDIDTGKRYSIVPSTSIHKANGFDELINKLSLIQHLRKSSFSHINISNENIKEFRNECILIADFCKENKISMPVDIKGLIQNKAKLNHYKSDTLSEIEDVEYINSKVYIEKYDEQRIRNTSDEKIADNFRYCILRANGMADGNVYPFGIRLDDDSLSLAQYDRSNLVEFEIVNLIRYMNPQDLNLTSDSIDVIKNQKVDKLSKPDAIQVLEDILESFPDSCPEYIYEKYENIKEDSASATYSIFDLIDTENITDLLESYNHNQIWIGHHDVISKELESLNNKNNPWNDINFLYQKIKQITNVSFVKEAKVAKANEEYEEVVSRFDYLVEKAPEYCLVPVICLDVFSKSDLTQSNNNSTENFENIAYLMEGKKIYGKNTEWLLNKYRNITEIPAFKYSLIQKFYDDDVFEVVNKYFKKLKDLKKIIKSQKKKSKHNSEALDLVLSKIDGIVNNKFGYNTLVPYIIYWAGNGKTIKQKTENVVKAVELFFDTYFGDSVFTIDSKSKVFKIKDDSFRKLITDTDIDGYANSHLGRSEYFVSSKLDDYKRKYEEYEEYVGSNDELCDKHIEEIKSILNVTKFVFYEDTNTGKLVPCGFDKNKKINVTWEHLENDKQNNGTIRAKETNSLEGNKVKSYDSRQKFFEHIRKVYDKKTLDVKKMYESDLDFEMTKLYLDKLVSHYKNN